MNKSKKLEDKLIRILTSSFLHLWMFIGFSNSSSRALHRVLSLSNSLWMWYTSSLQRKWVNMQHILTSNFPDNRFRILKIQLNWHQIFSTSNCIYLSYLRSFTLATLFSKMAFARLSFLISSLSTLISSNLWLYWISPLFSVDCWILIFSYRRANSSFLLTNCVPRISLSLITCNCQFFFSLIKTCRI